MRFVLGAFLLTGFALWAQQNEIFSPKLLGQAFDQAKQIGHPQIAFLDDFKQSN